MTLPPHQATVPQVTHCQHTHDAGPLRWDASHCTVAYIHTQCTTVSQTLGGTREFPSEQEIKFGIHTTMPWQDHLARLALQSKRLAPHHTMPWPELGNGVGTGKSDSESPSPWLPKPGNIQEQLHRGNASLARLSEPQSAPAGQSDRIDHWHLKSPAS